MGALQDAKLQHAFCSAPVFVIFAKGTTKDLCIFSGLLKIGRLSLYLLTVVK
jgi:hypothetical protein